MINMNEITTSCLRTSRNDKSGFTLAEVLITLGVIGVVSAITLPTLVQNYKNHVVETRLKKFYSMINQAVQRAESDYGNKKYWHENLAGAILDDNNNPIAGTSKSEEWFKKYLGQYLTVMKYDKYNNKGFLVYFADGSALSNGGANTITWIYYPVNPNKCIPLSNEEKIGTCAFMFNFYPSDSNIHLKDKGFEPYKVLYNGNEDTLYSGCEGEVSGGTAHGYCTALIQNNGWKIPKNYPRKIKY